MENDLFDCTLCPNKIDYPISSLGKKTARILILTSSPNFSTGEPIDEISQKVLDKILEKAYIVREDVYITSTVRCVDGNVQNCKRHLWNELKEIKPKVIFALGKESFNLLIKGKTGTLLSKLSGTLFYPKYIQSIIIPTYSLQRIADRPSLIHNMILSFIKGNFIMNKALGKVGERFVQQILLSAGIDTEENYDEELLIEYDLECKIGKKKFTVECKVDRYSEKSGNICLEYWDCKKDQPSGINATTADIYIYVLPDGNNLTVWAIATKNLKKFYKDVKPIRKIEKAGDNNACIVLYKDVDILPFFTRLDNVSEKEVRSIIKRLLK